MKPANYGNKNPKEHSNKDCWCGCHNASNAKRNRNHHSTKSKLDIQAERVFKRMINGKSIPPEFSRVVSEEFWDLI
jgi:hypothetical protein